MYLLYPEAAEAVGLSLLRELVQNWAVTERELAVRSFAQQYTWASIRLLPHTCQMPHCLLLYILVSSSTEACRVRQAGNVVGNSRLQPWGVQHLASCTSRIVLLSIQVDLWALHGLKLSSDFRRRYFCTIVCAEVQIVQ